MGATSPMYPGGAAYAYDTLDNLVRVKAPGRDDLYCYDASNRLAFVRTGATTCSNGAATTALGYDLQGNVQFKNEANYDFDYGNRLREVMGVERYRYDDQGRRILAMNFATGVVFSQYGQNGQLLYQQNTRTGQMKETDHVYLAGSLVAQREVPIGGGTAVVKYQHTDALGSPVAVTNEAGGLVERTEYEPYGKQLSPSASTGNDRPGYTGHVEDRATGLTYMQQRYYDPGIGLFLSVDPVTAHSDPVGQFHRYRYANNNPYTNIDPDGRRCVVANSDSVYCMRRDIYRAFDRGAAGSTRFFGAAALTVEYLANRDIPGVRFAGRMGGGINPEANQFLDGVSSALYSLNAKTYSQIRNGSLSGPGLDAKLVSMEQTAVQAALDALPTEQRNRITESINSSFGARWVAGSHPADRAYNRVLDGVEKGLGRAIDFGNQSDREAIGNALIKDLRSSGACTTTGTRIRSC
ncbi:RHS repeat-associated core domain-containing protein [Luteimonas sp. MC1572]|uniref:RHS repeat domain-containing protein n=1 Tax=Luteimonas sp. MC1572 TaxID=2799325 RepID=UPI001F24CF9E|nr:RHS repeat-associated core domain-containing protein [Luteimonas sp. MC1572]